MAGENVFQFGSFPRMQMEKTFETYTTISMTSDDNHELLSSFEFPKLEMLLLKDSQPSDKFQCKFFSGMQSLKVLIISNMKFKNLPLSITRLWNLWTLHLEQCELSDISAITSLNDLLFLSLRKSKIDELPKKLKNLSKLKLLDLNGCSKLKKIPAGVISRFTNLEVLYMMDGFKQWDSHNFESPSKKDELDDNKDNKEMVCLIELQSLSYLDVLEIHVPKIHLLPDNLLFPHLSRFSISIGNESKPCDNIHSKLLFLRGFDARRPLQQCINCLLKETEHLSLEEISGLKNVVDSLDEDGFRNLKSLLVRECSDMEYIVTANVFNEDGGAFPKLETLTVDGGERPRREMKPHRGMDNLKVIYHGPPSHYSFRHLKELKLSYLKGLRNFWDDQDMHSNQPFFNEKMKFPSLEELEIEKVDGIVELWNLSDVEEKVPAFPKLVKLTLDHLPKLQSIWRSKDIVIYRSFQTLKSLKVSYCPKLEILCPFYLAAALKQLETLNVVCNINMKEIIAKETGELKNNEAEITLFSKLRNMYLLELPDLQCFFGGSTKLVFSSLEIIHFNDLKKMVTFVNSEYPGDSDTLFNDKVALPAIKHIEIYYVDGPKEIWGRHLNTKSFNELESLTVCKAKEATKVFSLDAIKQMQNLKKLDLQGFQLAGEFIEHAGFYNDDVENSALLLQLKEFRIASFPLLKQIQWKELALQDLRCLKISEIHCLTYLFSTSVGERLVNLEELDVSDCQKMREVVVKESGDTNIAEVKIVFPHLNILRLGNLPALRSLSPANVIFEFLSIKEVAFHNLQNLILLDLLQKFQHVKELQLGGCDLEGCASVIPPRLRNLTLSSMKYYSQVIPWKIFPIKNLHYLKISDIDGLKFLFPASLGSKGFARLEEIHIEGCKDIEQVFAQESTDDTSNNAASTTIAFPRVKIIYLHNLQRLRSFSSESYKDLEFPSLKEVEISYCPIMESFSYGSLNTPALSKIKIGWRDEKECSDLNAEIKKMKEEWMSKEDTETESTEEETSQRIKEETMWKDRETKFMEGETSQWPDKRRDNVKNHKNRIHKRGKWRSGKKIRLVLQSQK